MVAQVELNAQTFKSYVTMPRQPVCPNDAHPYLSRGMNCNNARCTRHLQQIETQLRVYNSNDDICARLISHRDDVISAMQFADVYPKADRYVELYAGILVDRIGVLEEIGGMAASKQSQAIISLTRFLPEFLAFICHETVELVRGNLENNCATYGISLPLLCEAMCSHRTSVLNMIPLQCLYGISVNLDVVLDKISRHPAQAIFNIGNEVLDLRSPEFSRETRLTSYVLFMLTCLEQYILNTIITQYSNDSGRSLLLTSKTAATLVFQVQGEIPQGNIQVSLRDDISLTIPMFVLSKGGYLPAIVEGRL